MDNTRLILVVSLTFVLLLLWQAWQHDYGLPAALPPAEDGVARTQAPDLPEPSPDSDKPAVESVPGPLVAPMSTGVPIRVRTDTLELEINPLGAVIQRVALLSYPVRAEQPDEPFILLDDTDELLFIEQDGLLSDQDAANHRTAFEADEMRFEMGAANTLEVALRWRSGDGLAVRKVFTFTRGSHAVNVRYEVENRGSRGWEGRPYAQLQRAEHKQSRMLGIYTFTGAALSSPDNRYQKFSFDDMQDESIELETTDGWIAVLQHYFVAALIPHRESANHYYSKTLPGDRYVVGFYGANFSVAPGTHGKTDFNIYVGPKSQHVLSALAPGLDLTVDYGVLWFIAKPLFWLLEKIHLTIGNWGWSIVLLTMLVKGAFFYPSAVGYRSMAKMRRIQPRLVAIRERYAKDRVRLQQAMMDLYKEERINPLSGCLPILIQIPVFIALYWVLLESVELRQARFALWITDLSSPDPFFVLPLVMGVTMFAQQKLNPAPLDPIQQKVMQFLPVVFTVMFAWFPSGLVLYWTVSNMLSILQQWVITRQIEGAPSGK